MTGPDRPEQREPCRRAAISFDQITRWSAGMAASNPLPPAALQRLPRLAEQMRRALRPMRLATTLYPAGELTREAEAGIWSADGSDPHFYVPARCRSSLVRVRYRATLLDAGQENEGLWRLYYDLGEGFREQDSFSVATFGPEIELDLVIGLPGPVSAFRLDPVPRQGRFRLHAFEIESLSGIRTRLGLAAARVVDLHRRGLLRAKLTEAAKLLAKGDGRDLGRRLFRLDSNDPCLYQRWVDAREVTPERHARFVEKGRAFALRPRFSLIMPTYNSPPAFLDKALESVLAQTYPDWELLVVDNGSVGEATKSVLERFAARDARIKVRYLPSNTGIAAASNMALAAASGDYIALIDHDDTIEPHALHAFAEAINRRPAADWLYSDEDKIDVDGRRSGPFFKPDWSPAYFLSCMYTCHLGVYRTSLVRRLGGFRSEFDFAQDYDLALRVAAETTNIVHVPDMLYHWRMLRQSTASGPGAKPQAEDAARRALQDFLDRGRYPGQVEEGPVRGTHRVRFDIAGAPLVSIAIPSAGYRTCATGTESWFVLDLVRSIRARTSYPNIEIVIADNGDFDPRLTQQLTGLGARIVHYAGAPFNLSDKMNLVVEATRGDYVILLNDDMSVITPDWVGEMLMWCQQDGVSGVGAKLIFPDQRLQHVGVLLLGQGPSHPYYLHDRSEIGQVCSAIVPRDYSAVTGACMMVRRSDFLAVGGFDPAFRINYNDVDFCLKLNRHTGGHFVFTPYACLHHYESVSRPEAAASDLQQFNAKWASAVGHDPYYNPHLSQRSARFEISANVTSLEESYGLGTTAS
jgi:GT2 family glycosyltransferase